MVQYLGLTPQLLHRRAVPGEWLWSVVHSLFYLPCLSSSLADEKESARSMGRAQTWSPVTRKQKSKQSEPKYIALEGGIWEDFVCCHHFAEFFSCGEHNTAQKFPPVFCGSPTWSSRGWNLDHMPISTGTLSGELFCSPLQMKVFMAKKLVLNFNVWG